MPRAPRSYEPGAIYHLTAHGIDERPIFRDDVDRQDFVVRLARLARERRWRFFAICLMDTHYHLVLTTRDGLVSPGMRELNGGHSRTFNARHARRGALFESRYRERLVRDDRHLLKAIRYVALNPVRAGMVATPESWPWSTYAQLIGLAPSWPCFVPAFVHSYYGRTKAAAIDTITAFVAEGMVSDTGGVRHSTQCSFAATVRALPSSFAR
jgi:REP element-mobilizing transposase RayT